MGKRICVLALVLFFAMGSIAAMAGEGTHHDKGVLQGMYDWFGAMDKPCHKDTACRCSTGDKTCCAKCATNCGAKCCDGCSKK